MAKKTTRRILLPRGYLSYTQKELWKRDKDKYKRIYFYGEEHPKSIYMTYGSKVADDAELGESDDLLIDALNTLLPTYKDVEKKINAEVQTDKGLLTLHGRLDVFNEKPLKFRERKTGTRPWTQGKVDKHSQIDFYTMLIYQKYGRLPDEAAYLDWAETELEYDEWGNPKGLTLTGKVEHYKAERSLQDVLRELGESIEIALEISKEYEAELLIKK